MTGFVISGVLYLGSASRINLI